MQRILFIAAVFALFTLAVGGVSAHDGNGIDSQMNEMMDQCMEMAGQMGEMMGSNSIGNNENSESMSAEMAYYDEENEESSHKGMEGC